MLREQVIRAAQTAGSKKANDAVMFWRSQKATDPVYQQLKGEGKIG